MKDQILIDRRARAEHARQCLMEQTRARVMRHAGGLPASTPFKEKCGICYKRSQRAGTNLSRAVIKKYLSE